MLMSLVKLKRRLFTTRREQIEDYVAGIRSLFWQRQGIYLAVFALTVFYLDARVAFLCYISVLVTELLDLRIAQTVDKWQAGAMPDHRWALRLITVSTILSALAISNFVVNFALLQETGGHFPPLFFLFAAALFAAMNNHQIFSALIIREIIYGISFVTVALIDVVRVAPPLNDQIWLNFFTVIFVMYFIIDISRVFLAMYERNMHNLRKIKRENERSKEALQVKSNFVSTVSHELRTPLTSIKGSIDLINSGVLGEVPSGFANLLDIAGRNSDRLEKLINDVLDVQRMETEKGFRDFMPIDVAALLRESVEANEGFAEKHKVQLSLTGTLTDAKILGEERRLIQVITNLISNAVKFSEAGGLVEVWSERCAEGVKINVRDHGIGIPVGSREKVFGHFTQIDSSDQRRAGGSGLGMSISKQIVERHGGEIDYVSEQGKGSTFYIVLKELPAGEAVADRNRRPVPETGQASVAAE